MLLEEKSEEFKQFFLLALTKELIENSLPKGLALIEAKEEVEEEEVKEKAKELIKEHEKPLKMSPTKQLKAITETKFKPLPKPYAIKKAPRRLVIPQPRLPARLQYIKPSPTETQLDLGKLNQFIQNPSVQTIECNGPDAKIIIRTPVEKTTEVSLSSDEIDAIITAFANTAKIPVTEGIFRVAVGRLILSAIVSEVVGSKFIIKKMRLPPPAAMPRGPTPRPMPNQPKAPQAEAGFKPSL